jgi:hypothetical protein
MFVTHINSTTWFLKENKKENVNFDNVEYEKLKMEFIEQFSKLAKFFSENMKEETNE